MRVGKRENGTALNQIHGPQTQLQWFRWSRITRISEHKGCGNKILDVGMVHSLHESKNYQTGSRTDLNQSIATIADGPDSVNGLVEESEYFQNWLIVF